MSGICPSLVPSPTLLRFLRSQVDRTSRGSCWAISQRQSVHTNARVTTRDGGNRPQIQDIAQSRRRSCPTIPPPRPVSGRSSSTFRPGPTRNYDLATVLRKSRLTSTRTKATKYPRLTPPPLSYAEDPAHNPTLNRVPRLASTANELRLRCTEFDENGNVTLVNGEFKKSELIQKYGLLPRDLRKIDSSMLPHFLVRPAAILINLLHIRCLIKHNRVLVFDAYGSADSYTQSVFMYDLEGKLRCHGQEQRPLPTSTASTSPSTSHAHPNAANSAPGSLPYEFRALEAIMISVTSALESEFETVREPVVRVLRDLEENIDRDKLRHLLIFSKKLGTFEQKARLVRDAIDELLEADDDLADMYLSEKDAGRTRTEDDITEVEMLLESYHKVCDEIVQVSGNLVSNIRNTEEIVKAILDANRNSLMLLDLKFSIGTLGLAAGTFVAALYGMNLKNYLEETELGFAGVSAVCALFTGVAFVYGIRKLGKVQRLSMWGEGSSFDRGVSSGGRRVSGNGNGNGRLGGGGSGGDERLVKSQGPSQGHQALKQAHRRWSWGWGYGQRRRYEKGSSQVQGQASSAGKWKNS